MREPVLEVRGVVKTFRKPHTNRLRSFSALSEIFTRQRSEVLRDVSFTVQRGETIGLLGSNGSGKSTMLRILAGLTRPDRGTVVVREPVSGLLTIGEGLNYDLSGEENAFTTALLAGLTRAEARRRMSDIAAFAELEDVLDQPVRTYSDGMRLRLAFAASIAIEPKLLLIDELLAVGDIRFREKCGNRLQELQASGVTVILTSHDMGQIERMCSRSIWLQNGRVIASGATDDVAAQYRQAMADATPVSELLDGGGVRLGDRSVEVTAVRLRNSAGRETGGITSGDALTIEIDFHSHVPVPGAVFGVSLHVDEGVKLIDIGTDALTGPGGRLPVEGTVTLQLDRVDLGGGEYLLDVGVYADDWSRPYDYLWRAVPLHVIGEGREGTAAPPHRWTMT